MIISSLSYMWYLWILTKTIVMLCLLSHPTTMAYVELIVMETAHTYLQSIYCKVKQWFQKNESYNQIKMCMCVDMRIGIDIWWEWL
jgi:hypothetical protein